MEVSGMKATGMNMGVVKKQNRYAIIKYINQIGPVSRKDIAEKTGLTPASVTQITNNLIEEGILHELGFSEEKRGAGRKKILLDIDYDFAYLYSVNIETEDTTIALTNLKGTAIDLCRIKTDAGVSPEIFLKTIASQMKKMAAGKKGAAVANKIRAVSVGVPGLVDKDAGIATHAYGIWSQPVELARVLCEELNLPCYVENNVTAFTLATLYFGEGKSYDNLHVIKWGPGVGSSLLINGEVYSGRHGRAAELGHCIVEKNGKRCNCGRKGCLETKVSYQALCDIAPFGRDEFESVYNQAEKKSKEAFDEAIDLFARTLINALTIVAPNRLVLSGFMFQGKSIRDKLFEACRFYDDGITEDRLLYTSLASCETYIGPVASYIHVLINS